ncbi:hypothetical protein [Asticcacaulis sp. YBE204]|uniref:hypothetical protein n=1 Tax=Asticcacaulis sp. YBE204 TaxID=1282363 RepID=UPI0003C3AE9F|nr:hypothetical protein [Asticcacaulis sp. YBE204]ESQ78482.1 hypothetical protein AEYBE204_13080 [Asticcacaulis sp. YBE204]
MTKPYKPSDKVRTVADWIEQAAISGQPVTALQLRTWVVALRVPAMGLEMVERVLERAPGVEMTGAARYSADDAERLYRNASNLTERLAVAAINANNEPVPVDVINAAAHGLFDVLDALTYGVRRPDFPGELPPVTHTEIGA